MNRLFGKSRPKDPVPTLDQASSSMESRTSSLDAKIKTLDDELLRYKAQLSKMRPGAARTALSARALRCLQQKKIYDKQRDQLSAQLFNVDQAKFAQQNVKDTVMTVAAMKDAQKSLKVEMKGLKIDDVEDLHDDMGDLLEDADELNEIMGRSYGVPEQLDEADLLDELEAMEGEIEQEEESVDQREEVPSYLVSAAKTAKTISSGASASVPKQTVQPQALEEFDLPAPPARSLA